MGASSEQYNQKVMDHFTNPRNVGQMHDPDGVGHVSSPVCGDIMELYVKIKNDIIVDAKFRTFGCGAAIASSSMLTELIKGKSVREALEISNRTVVEALEGLPPAKIHCSVLAEDALRRALEDYLKKAKRALRRQIRLTLKQQSDAERNEKSLLIKKRLFALPAFKKAKVVMLYVSEQWEVNTQAMMDDALKAGKKVAVPYIFEDERRMAPSLIHDRRSDLLPGPYGIYQPRREAYRPIAATEVDVVVVPGIAFTGAGLRLGRGGGYYDVFLKGLPERIATVGIAFGQQVVAHIPQGTHDVPVQKLITEAGA